MKTLTVKVPESVFMEIAANAKARNVSKSEIIRERLARRTASAKRIQGSLWDRMKDLVMTEGPLPTDLSSNKAHMKNYGKNRADR